MKSYFYTFILMFALYMTILMYGQFVAQSVVTEKSSKAMELLITSAKPSSLMFGKVVGTGLAGLVQLVLIVGSAFVFFNLNKSYWDSGSVITSLFDMPLELVLYTILFFVTGYFLYAFLFGALASLASRMEDTNTLVMPVVMLFVASFMATIFSMVGGKVDSVLMKVLSFVPFTSPMAMLRPDCDERGASHSDPPFHLDFVCLHRWHRLPRGRHLPRGRADVWQAAEIQGARAHPARLESLT